MREFDNDHGMRLYHVLAEDNGPISLQSAQDPSGVLITLSGSVSIDNATGGTCHYTVATGDLANPDTLLAQISAAYGSETISWGGFQIVVLPALPKAIN
jgi:hypothetical protein